MKNDPLSLEYKKLTDEFNKNLKFKLLPLLNAHLAPLINSDITDIKFSLEDDNGYDDFCYVDNLSVKIPSLPPTPTPLLIDDVVYVPNVDEIAKVKKTTKDMVTIYFKEIDTLLEVPKNLVTKRGDDQPEKDGHGFYLLEDLDCTIEDSLKLAPNKQLNDIYTHIKLIEKTITKLDTDLLRTLFGNGKTIRINKNGVKTKKVANDDE